ncbi:F-box protein At2g26850-like [Coffea eugenioides]|uniref:F-box protein At2g26850-like n=1 Tax=Coffea eugenioides TaxID=49369 RepID=UPI000F606086|nr:F-box protein At2g26850-like [Coffea eugenioides]
MLLFLISCFSVILVSKSFFRPFGTWKRDMRMQASPWFLGEVSRFLISWSARSKAARGFLHFLTSSLKKNGNGKAENVMVEGLEGEEYTLLDLPDLALECILERLSPFQLCSMAAVCRSLSERCSSDHLWEKHMKQKWGRLVGNAAYQQWQCYIASRNRAKLQESKRGKGLLGYFSIFSDKMWNNRSRENEIVTEQRNSLPVDSVKAWYLAIETGKLRFPAQVYNRENGQVGFMLSCYDAELSYDSSTDTFIARYSAPGRRPTIEDNIEWNRIRAPAVDVPAHVLHVSDCLHDLKPGDHIEVQWRRNRDFPYGWWYGVVGHLESCTGQESHCQCHLNDSVVLEFKQYAPSSRWRQTIVNRRDHREVGNGADGFYGGIRKLCNENEISTWKSLWPTSTLE